jgi:heme-degrading monooxygenase HmoA
MILRVVRELVREGLEDEYEPVVRASVAHFLANRPGLVAHWLGPSTPRGREWVVASLWTDLDAIRDFAGEAWQEIVLNDRQREMLETSWVHHYDVGDPPAEQEGPVHSPER